MMTHIRTVLILILWMWLGTACNPTAGSNEPETTDTPTPLMIRVHNNSHRVFDSVTVQFPEQTEQYGVVGVGSSSEYHAVSQAYAYAYVQVMVGGQAFTLQPIDYVGESLLPPGEYTYVLDISEGQLFLTLAEGDDVIEDESIAVVPATATAVLPTEAPPTESPPTTAPMVDLNGTQWVLVAFGTPDRPASVLPNTQPTAEFLDGQITGTTGCNQYSTPFTQDGNQLTAGPVISTRRACTPDINQQEMEILQGWETAVSYQLSQDTLTIEHEQGVLVFVAQTAVEPEAAAGTVAEDIEAIMLLSPANGSRVASPVTISGESEYAFEGTLSVEVVTLDGASVGTGFAMLDVAEMGQRGPFSGEVIFESPPEPTPGRISVFMTSARDGHIEHLASTSVTLLPEGEAAEVVTETPQAEAIAIHTPIHLDNIQGGTVHIGGFAAPTFEQNLVIEILDSEGNIVGNGFATISSSMGEWGPFQADITYAVTAETLGAVCVQDISPADGGLAHRNCIAVTLAP